MITQEFPTITIDLPDTKDKIYFESLKIANTCENSTRH